MSHVDFRKWPYHPVEFERQGPLEGEWVERHDDPLSADYVLNSFHILNLFKHDRRHCPTHWLSAAPVGCIYIHAARIG